MALRGPIFVYQVDSMTLPRIRGRPQPGRWAVQWQESADPIHMEYFDLRTMAEARRRQLRANAGRPVGRERRRAPVHQHRHGR